MAPLDMKPNELEPYWVPFTANRAFKKRPRLFAGAKGVHYFKPDGGKVLTESDPEVSEAVDFAVFYPACARFFHALGTIDVAPRGVVVVVPPWNFPIAIPCGGVTGALAAGNTVILKPASDTVLVAYELCQCFWRAGVPKEVLQFVPCSGASGGAKLVSSPDVDAVVLTGGTDTALRMPSGKSQSTCSATVGHTPVSACTCPSAACRNRKRPSFAATSPWASRSSMLAAISSRAARYVVWR